MGAYASLHLPSRGGAAVIPRELRGQRLAALAVLGALLLNEPLLTLVDRTSRLFGIPVLYLWIYAVWALLILLMAVVAERRGGGEPVEPGA